MLSPIFSQRPQENMFLVISTMREYSVNWKIEINYIQVRNIPDEQLNNNYRFDEKSLSYKKCRME